MEKNKIVKNYENNARVVIVNDDVVLILSHGIRIIVTFMS